MIIDKVAKDLFEDYKIERLRCQEVLIPPFDHMKWNNFVDYVGIKFAMKEFKIWRRSLGYNFEYYG